MPLSGAALASTGLFLVLGVTALAPAAAQQSDAPGKARLSGPAKAGTAGVATKTVSGKNVPGRNSLSTISGVRAAIAQIKARNEARQRSAAKLGVPAPKKFSTGYLEALLYRMQIRAYPKNFVDYEAYRRAARHRSRMPAARLGPGGTPAPAAAPGSGQVGTLGRVDIGRSSGRWQPVGPLNLGVPFRTYFGPLDSTVTGRVNDIAFDPSVQGVAYLATAGGGIWKTPNGGRNWAPVGDSFPFLQTNAVAVDPKNSSVLYAGLGDYNGFQTGYSLGMMKSVDGGRNWTNIGNATIAKQGVSSIVVDPQNAQIITVTSGRGAAPGGIWRSINGGLTFGRVAPEGDWSDIEVGAPNAQRRSVYYATQIGGGLYRSVDQGATWNPLPSLPLIYNGGSPGDTFSNGLELAASRVDPNTVYVVDASSDFGDGRIYRSTDAGLTWFAIDPGLTDVAGDVWGQCWYDLHLTAGIRRRAGQKDTDILYAGTLGLSASRGQGLDWSNVSRTSTFAFGFDQDLIHTDQQCMAVDPFDPNHMLVGNDGGVYGLAYDPNAVDANGNPTAAAWTFDTRLNSTLTLTQFYHADWHPTDASKMMGGSQDNSTPHSQGNLTSWKNVGGGDGAGCAFNPGNPAIQYCSAQGQAIFRTANEWQTSAFISPDWGTDRLPFIGTLAVDRLQPRYLYAGTHFLWRWDENTWRWDENTQTWTARIGNQALSTSGIVTAISVQGGIIYTGSSDGELWAWFGGPTWRRLNVASLPNRAITTISINPANPADIMVGLSGTGSGHVYRCATTFARTVVFSNQSGSGARALPDIPLNALTRDVEDPAYTFYAATDIGVFTTIDAGQSWSDATTPLGLPNAECTEIKNVKVAGTGGAAGTNYLNVATFGRGMWRFDLANVVVPGDPSIKMTPALRRDTNGDVLVTVTLTNTGGTATDVKITGATFAVGAAAPINAVTALPAPVGAIGSGMSRTIILRFPGSVGGPGTLATLNVTGTYTGGTLPAINVRTRLP